MMVTVCLWFINLSPVLRDLGPSAQRMVLPLPVAEVFLSSNKQINPSQTYPQANLSRASAEVFFSGGPMLLRADK